MAKIKKNSIVTGIAVGTAVGTATMLISNGMSKKNAIKKNANKAVNAVASMFSAMQG